MLRRPRNKRFSTMGGFLERHLPRFLLHCQVSIIININHHHHNHNLANLHNHRNRHHHHWEDFLSCTNSDSCCTVLGCKSIIFIFFIVLKLSTSMFFCHLRSPSSSHKLQRFSSPVTQTVVVKHDEPRRRHRCTSGSMSGVASLLLAEPLNTTSCPCSWPGASLASWSVSPSFSSSSSACSLPTT